MAGPFRWGRGSREKLATCHSDLVRVLDRALGYGVLDFSVVGGHRGRASQEHYFATGLSQIQWPHSKHNREPSDAVDVVPWMDGRALWDDRAAWFLLAGLILAAASEEGVQLRWGGNWDEDASFTVQAFDDLGHFERKNNA